MRNNFTTECLSIDVERTRDNQLRLSISSDFSGSNRKSQLYINEKRLAEEVERLWKSIKTKKLLRMSLSFDEIDHYDDMTDIYTTPIIRIERGLKRARISEQEHGSIPKDWTIVLYATFADTTTNTPILEVIKNVLGSMFTSAIEKEFVKKLRPVLQKKVNVASYYNNDDE